MYVRDIRHEIHKLRIHVDMDYELSFLRRSYDKHQLRFGYSICVCKCTLRRAPTK